jgi:acetyl esterase/lipase
MISKRAKVIEKILGFIRFKNIVSKMMLNPRRRKKYLLPPEALLRHFNPEKLNINNRECFSFSSVEDPKKHIFYFHGGAYTLQPNMLHWRIISRILKKVPCKVTFIEYPLTPEHTCNDAVNVASDIYLELCDPEKEEIILMGDSAGGGLALSLAQSIKVNDITPEPSKIVLLSPWLDVSMEWKIPEDLAAKDLILDRDTLKIIGKKYAGKINTGNYLCSPLYGDVSDIGEIAIFTSTNDILNIQAKRLKEKVIKDGGSIEYHEFKDMQHIWIGFPIPEARDAMEKVCLFIER